MKSKSRQGLLEQLLVYLNKGLTVQPGSRAHKDIRDLVATREAVFVCDACGLPSVIVLNKDDGNPSHICSNVACACGGVEFSKPTRKGR